MTVADPTELWLLFTNIFFYKNRFVFDEQTKEERFFIDSIAYISYGFKLLKRFSWFSSFLLKSIERLPMAKLNRISSIQDDFVRWQILSKRKKKFKP